MSWTAFEKALLDYDRSAVYAILDQNSGFKEDFSFIDEYIVKALNSIGDKWEKGEVALSQIYMSSKLCEEIAIKLCSTSSIPTKTAPTMAILTLEDYHTLGKRIVTAVANASGYLLKDYETISDLEGLLNRIKQDQVKILIISVLMYPSALKVKKIRELIASEGSSTKILVGGAPFLMDPNLWREVGADGFGRSALDSIAIIEKWIQEDSM